MTKIYGDASILGNPIRFGQHPKKCLVATAMKLAVKAYYDLLKCHKDEVSNKAESEII